MLITWIIVGGGLIGFMLIEVIFVEPKLLVRWSKGLYQLIISGTQVLLRVVVAGKKLMSRGVQHTARHETRVTESKVL